jgi:ankyrin repeat protein
LITADFGADVTLQDADGNTALHHSCSGRGSVGCAKILLSKNADCRHLLNRNGLSAFQLVDPADEKWKPLLESMS